LNNEEQNKSSCGNIWSLANEGCTTQCSEKKTLTRILFYIFMENVQISTNISGNVSEETSIPPVKKLDILCYQ